jgi:hypothetical protein
LHATIESRAIIISMQRKHPDVTVDQLTAPKPGDADNEFVVLRRKCARWAKDNLETLRDAKPKLPSELNGRTADNWSPLLAIADACGWGKRARRVTVAITNQKLNEVSPAEELLRDLKLVFKKLGGPLASKAIVDELVSMEARPWAAYLRGSPLTTTSMAALLKDFEIVPGEIKFTSRRAHGYRVEQFANAFLRWRK